MSELLFVRVERSFEFCIDVIELGHATESPPPKVCFYASRGKQLFLIGLICFPLWIVIYHFLFPPYKNWGLVNVTFL